MKKEYINMNVFDALQKRFAFLFQEFKNKIGRATCRERVFRAV